MKIDRDQRVRVTKKMIRDAFLKLLAAKPVRRITVRELCESAGINRGTFYAHYLDVYDLLEQIENELLEEFETSFSAQLGGDPERLTGADVCRAVFTLFQDNSELCAILLGDDSNKGIVEKFAEVAKRIYMNVYRTRFPEVSVPRLESFYLFVSAGCIALLKRWLEEGMPVSADVLAETAGGIMTEGMAFLLEEGPEK